MIIVKFKKLTETAVIPEYKTELAAGMDAVADNGVPIRIDPGGRALIPTGLAMQFPAGYECQVRPRSGLALKNGIAVLNSPGTIDADYIGMVGVILVNLSQLPFIVTRGDRVAQLVFAPVVRAKTEVVDDLNETARGAGGFGSTGNKT